MTAPMTPGTASRTTNFLSTLPIFQWAAPPATPVATLARLTVADTALGERPALSRIVELVGPNPMPSTPSIIVAVNPARATKRSCDDISTILVKKVEFCQADQGG